MKFYLSHSIRGKYGNTATNMQMKENCEKAILIANLIRNALPSIEIYCPAEHEDFVLTAYQKHYITEKQILDVDCSIIDNCTGVIIYVPEGDVLQGGRKIEFEYAKDKKLVLIFKDVEDIINQLAEFILRA